MPIDLAPGVIVRVDPPSIPVISMSPPPGGPTVVALPVVGPAGPRGLPGNAVMSYVHEQATPQSVVTIEHGLERTPAAVSLFSLDLSESFKEYRVSHLSTMSLRISMDSPTAFKALIS